MNPANVNEFFPDVAAQTKCTLSLDIENFFWRTYPVSEKDEATRERSPLPRTTAFSHVLNPVLWIFRTAPILNADFISDGCRSISIRIHFDHIASFWKLSALY
jgi:hypothetical protein